MSVFKLKRMTFRLKVLSLLFFIGSYAVFHSNVVSAQKAFANSGTATGVALELWQSNRSQAIPNSSTPITFPAGPNQDFRFGGRYIQTAPTVTSGTVNATVTAAVNYQ